MTTKLTLDDLENALNDDRRLGTAGYSDREFFSATKQARGNRIVIAAANANGFTYDQLVAWVDSKNGRWFCDELMGSNNREGAVAQVTVAWLSPSDRYLYDIPLDIILK